MGRFFNPKYLELAAPCVEVDISEDGNFSGIDSRNSYLDIRMHMQIDKHKCIDKKQRA